MAEGKTELATKLMGLLSKEYSSSSQSNHEEPENLTLNFTDKELNQMPQYFKKLFLINGYQVRATRRGPSIEIRYRRDGYSISACAATLEAAKALFLRKMKTAVKKEKKNGVPSTFSEFALYYFNTYRSLKVSATTLENDTYRLKNHILPHFTDIPLKKITLSHCQLLISKLEEQDKGKTCDEVYSLLNQIFKFAIANDLIQKNPMTLVIHEKHDNEHGTAFTKQEELELLEIIKGTRYFTPLLLSLYCGLRPNELETARIENSFIIAVNSKRKTKKVEYKKIPITSKLRPYMPLLDVSNQPPLRATQQFFSTHFPAHRLYDLRTTFNTRCQECGVAPVALSEFMGHSLGALQNAYTDLSDDFLKTEANKINY